MNAIALITDHETDYRDAMQRAAVAYLFRREGLHLSGDRQVLETCSACLAQSLEVPAHLVQRIAELAVAEFESKTTKRLQMIGVCASSGIAMYRSRTEKHIRPRWGDQQADRIDHLDIQHWVQTVLMPKLHNKTVREIVSHLRQIFQLYRTRNRFAFDPTDGITISLPDADDPDPFTREEITAILSQQTDREQEINLTEFMIWTGPRVSEAMALAWEDVDLVAGTVEIRRARVAGQYRVTKTRRSTRKVKLLAPALRALQAQAKFTQNLPAELIKVVDRDNRTMREQSVHFVFHNSATDAPYRSSDVLRHGWWITQLEKAGVRQRGPNTCRHTFASQMLSSGIATPEWIADQMGHTSTAMIFKHYAKWISEDGPDVVGLLNHALKLS